MNDKKKMFLKIISKFTKYFYRNDKKKSDHHEVLEKSPECTRDILEAKRRYILKMTNKLKDTNTALKSCCNILRPLL